MAAMVLSVFALTAALGRWDHGAGAPTRLARPAPASQPRSTDIVLARNAPAPRVYPYSVIPGGARTRQELTDAVARDAVVAIHYRGLAMGAVHPETVKEDRLAYMSYRIGNKIYWTKNKLRLSKGEIILTDGVTQIRSRCGNCISMQPMAPTSEEQPTTEQFEALTAGPAAVPAAAAAEVPPGTIIPRDLTLALGGPYIAPVFGLVPFGIGSGGSSVGGIAASPHGVLPTGGTVSSVSVTDIVPPQGPPINVPPGDVPNGNGGTPPGNQPPTNNTPPVIVTTVVPPPPGGGGPEGPLPPNTTPVPEPGTMLLVGSGVATLLSRRRSTRS